MCVYYILYKLLFYLYMCFVYIFKYFNCALKDFRKFSIKYLVKKNKIYIMIIFRSFEFLNRCSSLKQKFTILVRLLYFLYYSIFYIHYYIDN